MGAAPRVCHFKEACNLWTAAAAVAAILETKKATKKKISHSACVL
jgi:hypothetical protein